MIRSRHAAMVVEAVAISIALTVCSVFYVRGATMIARERFRELVG